MLKAHKIKNHRDGYHYHDLMKVTVMIVNVRQALTMLPNLVSSEVFFLARQSNPHFMDFKKKLRCRSKASKVLWLFRAGGVAEDLVPDGGIPADTSS